MEWDIFEHRCPVRCHDSVHIQLRLHTRGSRNEIVHLLQGSKSESQGLRMNAMARLCVQSLGDQSQSMDEVAPRRIEGPALAKFKAIVDTKVRTLGNREHLE